jgi:hypothetical protein
MHEGNPYGHLTINGKPPSITQIGANAGITAREAKKLLKELESYGVFSRTEQGIIFSRRMVKDYEFREKSVAHGRKGGNPALKHTLNPQPNHEPLTQTLNPQVNRELKLQEAEAERKKERVPTSSAQSATKQEQISPPEPQPENARDTLWRDGLATLRALTGQDANRARSLLGRLLKPLGDDCAALLAILDQARDLRPIDPVPWLIAAADARKTTPEQKHQDSVRKMFELLEQEEPEQTKPKPQLRIAK